MALIVNTIFSKQTTELTGPEVMIGLYAFAFQIYGDFSGYSSIAQGIAKWMGFDLMWNFKMPYLSSNPSEFWSRWHISLSTWLRDYLYIPLGGNKRGLLYTFRNLTLTMFLGGLWHGAGWTFIFWGLYHGFILVLYRIIDLIKVPILSGNNKYLKPLSIIIFFHLICISWLLFRAESLNQAMEMMYLILFDYEITNFAIYSLCMILFFVMPLFLFEIFIEKSGDLLKLIKMNWIVRAIIYTYIIFMMVIFTPLQQQDFIYFQF